MNPRAGNFSSRSVACRSVTDLPQRSVATAAPRRSPRAASLRSASPASVAVMLRSRLPSPAWRWSSHDGSILTHRSILHRRGLLIVRGYAGVETGAKRSSGPSGGVAENLLPRFAGCGGLFSGHFRMLPEHGRRRSFSAMPSRIARQNSAMRPR